MSQQLDKERLLHDDESFDEDDEMPFNDTPRWSRNKLIQQRLRLGLAAGAIFTMLLLITLVTFGALPALEALSARTGREFGDCGSSVEDARAKGCVFDYLSYVWVQPACYYPDLLKKYDNRTGVKWYTDPSLDDKFRIPSEEIMRGDHPEVWAPRKFHAMHCAFTVSKTHFALANHKPLDSRANSFEHTEHCQMILLDEMLSCGPGKCLVSKVSAKLTTCGWI